MPAKKKVSKKTSHKMIDVTTETVVPPVQSSRIARFPWSSRFTPFILGALVVLAILLYLNKGLFIAAVVNGRPIFRWDLNQAMMARFGKQTLEGMISEALIESEARRSGITVTPQEIEAKEQELLKSFGGQVSIEDLLKYQGVTKEDFDRQMSLQLTVQKILGKDIQITESDIDMYIATNEATLVATDPASLREEARGALFEQKVSEKVQPWFAEIKQKAQIMRFL